MAKENRNNKEGPKSTLFDVFGLTGINYINFKKAAELHVLLGVNNLQELYEACKEGEVAKLKGYGEVIQERIKSEIELNILWLSAQCNKVIKENDTNYQRPKADKNMLLDLAKAQKENTNF